MNVLFVAAEVAPVMKTGGLADVAAALPRALRELGHDVRIVVPRYLRMKQSQLPQEGPIAGFFAATGVRVEPVEVYKTILDGTPLYLLDIPAAFDRVQAYGMADDDARFILFARAVLGLMQHLQATEGWQIDVVHANDWHTALVPAYLKTLFARAFPAVASVYTIHNLAYQGVFSPFTLHLSGLTSGVLGEQRDGQDSFNFMARGILHSDVVTTVSPTYAREILTPEYGAGLHDLLRERRDRLFGILNGIDTTIFDPATDGEIAANFCADDVGGKAACKADLQQEMKLAVDPERPVIGMVTRLVDQKGLDLIAAIMSWLVSTNAQLVVLGTGDPQYERLFADMQAAHPDSIAARLAFDAVLARRIYAGSDIFLMPSRYEPGGLAPLIAMRYGSVPIVRATGGLNDMVREGWTGNGYRFHPYTATMLEDAIRRALTGFQDREGWTLLRERGMREDHSWAASARIYADLYTRARSRS